MVEDNYESEKPTMEGLNVYKDSVNLGDREKLVDIGDGYMSWKETPGNRNMEGARSLRKEDLEYYGKQLLSGHDYHTQFDSDGTGEIVYDSKKGFTLIDSKKNEFPVKSDRTFNFDYFFPEFSPGLMGGVTERVKNPKMDKWKKLGALAGAGLLLASPVVGASSGNELPLDCYDATLEIVGSGSDPESIMEYDGFKTQNKPLDEPIMTPDDVTDMILKEVYEKNGRTGIGIIKISPTDLAVWMAVEGEKTSRIDDELVYLDTDNDGKPEELAAMFWYGYNRRCAEGFEAPIKDHFKKPHSGSSNYLVNPFEVPKESLGNLYDFIYMENPDKITVMTHEVERVDDHGRKLDNATVADSIYWKDAVGKTPRELGLDKYDKYVSNPTPPDDDTTTHSDDDAITPDNDDTDEPMNNEVPGFEFATLGAAGMAAYLAAKYRKRE